MSDRPDYMGDESHDEIVAGEYVLGVLSLEDRAKVERRLMADPAFAIRVRRWQDNLESLDEAYVETRPPVETYNIIERRLFGIEEPESRSFLGLVWGSVSFWRAATLASVIAAFGIAFSALMLNNQQPAGKPVFAQLAASDSSIRLLAAYEPATGHLRLTPAASTPTEKKSLELWMIEDDGIPKSLGVVTEDGKGEIVVPDSLRSKISDGTTLAVSLEPFGGSPTGKATGPILAVGKIGM